MKKSCHKVTAVIPALLLVACVDNRNDFTGASPNSEETTASLPAPENLSATASDNEVSLSWDTVDGASAYSVYIYNESGYIQSNYSPANRSAADTGASAIVSTNSHLLSSLEYEVDYYFNVTALADDLESNQSNEVGVRPLQNFSNSTPSVQLLNTNVNAAEVVTLSAEVSDPDGNNISYLWQQTSGASIDIIDGNESEASFTAPTVDAPVELGFALTVFDNLGASSTSSATVTVSDNLSPQVDAGADQSVSPGATVDLLGSASDSDGSVVDIAWQQESGSIVSLSSNSTLDTSFTAPSANSSELTLVFQLSVTDDRGASATDTVTVLVAADQGSAIVYRVDVAENSNGTIHVATTMDPEQESLTYSLSGTDSDDFSIDSSSGAISFISTPDYEVPTDTNTDNAYELTFAVSNGTTTTLQELVITVIDVDEAPTITSAPDASTPENTTITFTASATDPESNPLSYSLSGTDAANFTINSSSGAISFTIIPDYENPADSDANNVYSLTLEVSDSTHTTSQALSITVTNVDEPPSITSATSANILENTTTTIYTASATDPENNPLSYSLSATDAAHLSIDPSNGAISFAINPDYENPTDADANNVYELTLEVSDSTHTTSQALAITVDDTNDNAPIITAAQSFSIDENSANGSAIGTVVATDADASPTTYQDWTITSGNTNAAFAIDSSSGELSVAAGSELDHESTASYTLALSVSDGVNTASAETLSINVNDVNDNAPIITAAQSFSIKENSANGSIIGIVAATDADTIPTTYQDWTITSGNTEAAFAIDSSSGELSVATSSELDYESTSSYTLELSVSDGVNSASAETLSINLSNVNEQPSFTSASSASINENDSSFAYTASATDVDAADSLTYSISGGADGAAFTLNAASLSFIAAPNYESPADSNADNTYEVELQVTDAGSLSDYLDLQISVANVNEAPSFISVDATVGVPENTSGTIYTLEASDIDSGDTDATLTYEIVSGADKLSFSLDGAELSFIDPPNYEAPQAAGSDANLYTVELAVSDDEGKASAANLILSFQVTDVNEAPSFTSVSGTYDVAENTSDTIFTLEASDVDSGDTDDTLTYSIAGGADRLSFSLDGNELSFAIPPPDYENPQAAGDAGNIYTVEIVVSDDDGKASETNLILSFNITDVNEAPTINSTTNTSVPENTTTTIYSASATDPESDTLTYSLSGTDKDDFIIDPSSGTLTFTNTPNYEAPTDADSDNAYQVTLEVSDGNANSATQALTISVTNVNEAPTITSAASASVPENTSGTIYNATTTDPENDTLTYALSGTDQDDFIIDPSSGAISFANKPDHESPTDADTNNVYQVTLEVSDGNGNSASQALTITVTDINETPTITSATSASILENNTTTIYTASATDPENDTLTYALSGTDQDDFIIDPSSGAISFANKPDHESPTDADANNIYELTLEVSDSTHTTSQALAITVDDTNDNAPIITAAQSFSIDENSANGSAIGTVVATDADASPTTYQDWTITSGNTNAAFAIDSSSGELSVAASSQLDHESTASYTLELSVSDGVNTASTETLSINVDDVNDNAPIITAAQSFSIDENSANGSTIGTVVATDADASPTTYQDWTITSGNTEAAFAIDSSSGELSVATSSELDYESTSSYTLELSVSDGVNSASAETLSINLSNVNEQPSFTSASSASINENDSSFAYTASAQDVDAADSLTYSISGGADAAAFTLNAASLSFIAAPNYESPADSNADNTYEVELQVTDAGSLSDYLDLQISVTDLNEYDVSFSAISPDSNPSANEIAENATAGTAVGITASASDDDGTNNTVSYSFDNDLLTSGFFSIDASSGVVTLTNSNSLDYETATSHNIAVKASSSDGSSATHTFTIAVTDVDDFDVSFDTEPDADSSPNQIAENATAGTPVGITASASDDDGTNNTVSYSFDNDLLTSGFFSIDASSGVVTLTNSNSLDYETATSHNIAVKASSSDGSSATHTFTVTVTDVDDFDVSFDTEPDADSSLNQIAEDATAGTPVGITASASDDDGTNNTVSYSFDNDLLTSGFFSIDASSGVVTLTNSNSLDYETATSHNIAVKASSSDGSSATHTFTVTVTDVDDFDVSFDTEPDADSSLNQIAEDATAGTPVGITASASDADGTNNTVSYSFDNDLLTSGFFSIDASSGVVTLTNSNSLDYETATSHNIAVKASSSDGSSATHTFTITVTDVDDFDVSFDTEPDADSSPDQIAENATAGTPVGITASAGDGDGTNNTVSYSFDNDLLTSGFFSIDASSGVVTLTNSNSLDYETATSHDIAVKASSSDGSSATHTFTITVTDVDDFDVSFDTEPDADSSPNQIAENATAGTPVGITASASDADGTNNTVSYSFDNDLLTSGFFSIDASSGVVTLTNSNSLDYETATSHNIAVKASSSDGSSATHTFTVTVTDVDDFDVSFDTEPDADSSLNQIAEDATTGTPVGITASASDADGTNNTVSYSFDNDLLTSGFFSIDASSGVVTLTNSNSLDYETATSHNIAVKASSSDGSSAIHTFTITVTDVDDFDVSFDTEPDADSSPNQIAEDAAAGTPVGITASAGDGDGTNNTVSYSFDNDLLTSGFFSIDASSGVVTLTNSNSLDYETATSHDIAVKATSSDGSSATHTFTITVTDVDDFDVSFDTEPDADSSSNQIAEDAAAGTAVGITASASDADGTNNTVSYSFDNDLLTSGFFSIDASSGVVTLTNSNSLDYETATSHDIAVKASSSDGSSATHTFTVTVTDVDDFDVSFDTEPDADSSPNQIAEDAAAGTAVGIIASASDGDGTNNTVSYSFDNDLLTSGFFSIDASSGVVTLTNSNSLDYETATSHDIAVKATSSDGSSATHTFTVSVIDVDEFNVVFATEPDADSSPNQIAEDAAAGTPVGITASASDADGTYNTVSYSFTNDNQTSDDNLFSIDPNSGIVKLLYSNSLDYETATSHDIAVKAASSDGSTDSETFTIDVTDINDNTPIITPSQSFDIDEASANDTSLGTVAATDADATATTYQDWTITAGNTNNAFAIDPSTGELTVNTSSELDYESGTILYTLSLTVSDGATTSAAEAITINILDVSEHDAAPSAAYLGLPDNYVNITFTPESGVSYQLHRSFVEGCTSSTCDAEGYKSFASPNSSGTADTMTFSQTHYYSLVGDNSTTFTTSINDSDGAKLAALVAAQSLSTEYDLANDWVNISATDSNNVTYTLYMAGEPFAAGGCEDSELDNIGSLCADGSSLSDGSMHSATEVINWSARRYYRLDISDGYQVVHSLESNASVIDPVLLNASNASLTIDITWSAFNSAKLAEYTVYLSDDSAATTASAATWSSLSNPQIISVNSSELYSLIPILSQYYVAITATNTENETTPLSKVYLVNNIVTGDPDPSTWHEIIADTDDSPAHWEGRSTHGSLVFQDKMWLIGGRTASENHIAEVWSSTDGYNWTEVNPSAAFGARKEFVSMVHDGKMWVLGGEIEGNLLANDVWYSSDGATWHEATPAASWHVRDYFGGVAFASGATGSDEIWVLGHYTGDARGIPGVEDHHYSTDGSTWSSVSVSGLPPSSFFPAITFNNVILIVGGYFYTNSAWSESNTIYSSTDGVNWAELSVSGSIWDARRLHTTLVYDDKLWILAGYSGYNRDDYWYSPDGTQWHEVMASGSKWEARQVHTSVNYAGRMWMLGGYGSTGDKQLNDVWASGLEITSFSFQEVLSNSL